MSVEPVGEDSKGAKMHLWGPSAEEFRLHSVDSQELLEFCNWDSDVVKSLTLVN